MAFALGDIFFSSNGIKSRGKSPPKTIPAVLALIVGSISAANRSAMTWAKEAPIIPAM